MLRSASAFAGLSAGLALALVAGCGGGESRDETGYAPLVARAPGKVEFLREAERICHSTNARVEAAADELARFRDPPPAEVRRVVISVAIPALEAEVRAIGAIGAPPGDEREVNAIIAATEAGIEELRADPQIVVDGPPPALRRAGRLARAYGSRECDVR